MTRPKIAIEKTSIDWGLELLAWAALAALLIISFSYYNSLPAEIPVHFNASGTPDSYGSKWTFLLFPVLGGGLFLILLFVGRVPHTFNYPVKITDSNAEVQYRLGARMMLILRVLLPTLFAYISYGMAQTALGVWEGLGTGLLFTALGAVLVTLIGYFVLAFRNK